MRIAEVIARTIFTAPSLSPFAAKCVLASAATESHVTPSVAASSAGRTVLSAFSPLLLPGLATPVALGHPVQVPVEEIRLPNGIELLLVDQAESTTVAAGWVVRAGRDKVETVATNQLGEECVASPAFQPGRIILRGEEHLFCIGEG